MNGGIKIEDLPEIMEPYHIQAFLGIGKTASYDLVKSNQFRVIKIGRIFKIPKEGFVDWLQGKKT